MDISIGQSAALTGDATESDVASGKTFYNTNAKTKLTGTYTPSCSSIGTKNASGTHGSKTISLSITGSGRYILFANSCYTYNQSGEYHQIGDSTCTISVNNSGTSTSINGYTWLIAANSGTTTVTVSVPGKSSEGYYVDRGWMSVVKLN